MPENTNQTNQIVYVLTNPAMPGLVKIGQTQQADVKLRMKQLYGTGVPVPFDCAFACQVRDANEVERTLHFAFDNNRINSNREFFKIEPERIIAILKLLEITDITTQFEAQIESDVTNDDKVSSEQLKASRRPNMDFYQIGIPQNSILYFKGREDSIKVVEARKVEFKEETRSLTSVTRELLGLPENYALQPAPYWTFAGRSVKDIYNDFHSSDDE